MRCPPLPCTNTLRIAEETGHLYSVFVKEYNMDRKKKTIQFSVAETPSTSGWGGGLLWSIEESERVHPSVVSSLADSHRNGCREKLVKEERRGRKWEALNSPGGVSLCDAMSTVHLHLTESSRFDKVSSCFTCGGLRLKEAKRLAQDHRDNKKHM